LFGIYSVPSILGTRNYYKAYESQKIINYIKKNKQVSGAILNKTANNFKEKKIAKKVTSITITRSFKGVKFKLCIMSDTYWTL